MRAGSGTQSAESRGATSWNDWFDPIDGARSGNGSISKAENTGIGTRGTRGRGEDPVSQTSGPDALIECKDGVCPVPWAVKEEAPVIVPDTVNHPSHYIDGGIECIEAIESQLTNDEYRGYLKGNIAKYIWRERMKGSTESLKKAQWYLDRLIQLDETQNG